MSWDWVLPTALAVVGLAVTGTLALGLLRRGSNLIGGKPGDPAQPITSRDQHDYSAAK